MDKKSKFMKSAKNDLSYNLKFLFLNSVEKKSEIKDNLIFIFQPFLFNFDNIF